MENINTTCHRLLKEYLTKEMIAIDATAGNGNDTFFLCVHCGHVYAYDIQLDAIENTKKRCSTVSNLTLYHASHEEIQNLNIEVDVIIFNFGYLPKSDSLIVTKPESSIRALESSYNLLKEGGKMMLACYVGHPGGREEHEAVKNWVSSKSFEVISFQNNYENAPILYECTKRKRA